MSQPIESQGRASAKVFPEQTQEQHNTEVSIRVESAPLQPNTSVLYRIKDTYASTNESDTSKASFSTVHDPPAESEETAKRREAVVIDVLLTDDEMLLYKKFKKMMQKEQEEQEESTKHYNDEILAKYENVEIGGMDLILCPGDIACYRCPGILAKAFEYLLIACVLIMISDKEVLPKVFYDPRVEIVQSDTNSRNISNGTMNYTHTYNMPFYNVERADESVFVFNAAAASRYSTFENVVNGTNGTQYGMRLYYEPVGLDKSVRGVVILLGFCFLLYILFTMFQSLAYKSIGGVMCCYKKDESNHHPSVFFDILELGLMSAMQILIVLQYDEFGLDLILNGVAMLFIAEIDETVVKLLGGNNKDVREYVILAHHKYFAKDNNIDLDHIRMRNFVLEEWDGLVMNGGKFITDNQMTILSDMLHLSKRTRLTLGEKQITDVGATKLAEALPGSKLTKLYLQRNEITDVGVTKLAEALPGCNLTELDISGFQITDIGATKLAEALPDCNLTKLDLGRNQITYIGATKLAEALPNSKVQTLRIDRDRISPITYELIKAYTGVNRMRFGCTELNLWEENITDVGVTKLAEALPDSKLTKLYLSRNQITDVGAAKLAEALPDSNLTLLTLYSNKITDIGATKLAEALPRSNLTQLLIQGNQIKSYKMFLDIKNKSGRRVNVVT